MTRGAVAELSAVFAEGGARLRTQAPLELRGPFRQTGAPARYFLRNTTAGIFAGDRYDVDLEVAARARVQVASSSATKVYAMPDGAAAMRACLHAAAGSTLVWGPHATILQACADYTQEVSVRLEPGATVLAAEALALGRLARGEYAAFRRFVNTFRVLDARGDALYEERYVLTPGPDLVSAMGGHGVLASFYLLGRGACDDAQTALQAVAATAGDLAGVSRLPNEAGLVLRGLCRSLARGEALLRRAIEATAASIPDGDCA